MGEGERGVGLLSETSSQLLEEKLLDKDIVLICKHPKTKRVVFLCCITTGGQKFAFLGMCAKRMSEE